MLPWKLAADHISTVQGMCGGVGDGDGPLGDGAFVGDGDTPGGFVGDGACDGVGCVGDVLGDGVGILASSSFVAC